MDKNGNGYFIAAVLALVMMHTFDLLMLCNIDPRGLLGPELATVLLCEIVKGIFFMGTAALLAYSFFIRREKIQVYARLLFAALFLRLIPVAGLIVEYPLISIFKWQGLYGAGYIRWTVACFAVALVFALTLTLWQESRAMRRAGIAVAGLAVVISLAGMTVGHYAYNIRDALFP